MAGPDCSYSRSLVNDFDNRWVPFADRGELPEASRLAALVLRELSFHNDPNATLEWLAAVVEWACDKPGFILAFQDELVTDVVPYMILSEMAPVLRQARANRHVSLPVARVLDCLDIDVRLPDGMRSRLDQANDLMGMRLRRREELTPKASNGQTPEEFTAQEAVGQIDAWLQTLDTPRHLVPEANYYLTAAMGEILGNAARHANPATIDLDGNWRVAAFMGKRQDGMDGETVPHCYLGFINEGVSFAQSLATANDETKANLLAYQQGCLEKGAIQSLDTLATVFALKDGVTRIPNINEKGAGGLGLMSILRFVKELGATDQQAFLPRITILSGASCIQVRDHHLKHLGAAMQNEDCDNLDTLWFNAANSIDAPPDSQYVFDLNRSIPGTALTIDFILDERFL